MLNNSLDKIDLKDIESLIQNAVAEGKSIDYKLSLPDNSDKGKKEFLADVSSFANTSGGDLIYGIKAEKGVPVAIEGITVSNADEEILKYDDLILLRHISYKVSENVVMYPSWILKTYFWG